MNKISHPAALKHGGSASRRPTTGLDDRESFENTGALRPVQEGLSGRRGHKGSRQVYFTRKPLFGSEGLRVKWI